jgi:hypothetical protein
MRRPRFPAGASLPVAFGNALPEQPGEGNSQPGRAPNGGGNGGCHLICTPCDATCERTCSNTCTGRSVTGSCCLAGFICQNGRCACPNPSVCLVPPNSTATCINGVCGFTCDSGFTQCGDSCTDLDFDPTNCGSCGNSCSSGSCCLGTCCPTGTYCSEGRCCPRGTYGCGYGRAQSCCPAGQCCDDGRCNCNGVCCGSGFDCFDGACVAIATCPPPLTTATCPPRMNLSGNSNYIFVDSACGNIADLMVTVNLTQELTSSAGFSIQLNTYAPPGLEVGSMQYVMVFEPYPFFPVFNLYHMSGDYQGWACTGASCNEVFGTPNWLGQHAADLDYTFDPIGAGNSFGFRLSTNPAGAVTAVTFLTDGIAKTVSLPRAHQFPVAGFQLNVVGDDNNDTVTFNSAAAGNIQYSVPSGTLCSLTAPGISCSNPNFTMFTGECSNIVYTGAACCGTVISQGMNN